MNPLPLSVLVAVSEASSTLLMTPSLTAEQAAQVIGAAAVLVAIADETREAE